MAMVTRLRSLSRDGFSKEWSRSVDSDWDVAVTGNSPLLEAFLKILDAEVTHKLGGTYGAALLDIKSFYDNIRFRNL
eukprot:7231705-Pyramimonas_sp.AAC.1